MITGNFLQSALKQFKYYKALGDKVLDQLEEASLHKQYNAGSNSIAVIMKHLAGNLTSRWTDFLSTDGEKPWRNRDDEFEESSSSKADLIKMWEKGWGCVFSTLENLTPEDIEKTVRIRDEKHSVPDAIHRSLAHCAYHVGQIVFVGKLTKGEAWVSLTIPKNKSTEFNNKMFGKG